MKPQTNGTYSFTYDDTGLRQSKTKNGVTTRYYYDGTTLIAEETDGNITAYIYDATGAPIGFYYRASTYAIDVWDIYYYEKNLQGDIVAIYNTEGIKLISFTYDAWGNRSVSYHNGGRGSTATKGNLSYRGYFYDTNLGLYCVSSRYYDANTGRWISPDNITAQTGSLNGHNLYVYCENNPVVFAAANYYVTSTAPPITNGTVSTKSPYGDAKAFEEYINGDMSSTNCYGFAIGVFDNVAPGYFSAFPLPYDEKGYAYDVYDVAERVISDMKALGRSARIIAGPYAPIGENEYRIAIRKGGYATPFRYADDFHFMVQTNTGQWADKHSTIGVPTRWALGLTPEEIN